MCAFFQLIAFASEPCQPYCGGYGDGVPPLPIPNREVKPVHADGTASSGRVGSRPLLINVRKPPAEMARRLSSFSALTCNELAVFSNVFLAQPYF